MTHDGLYLFILREEVYDGVSSKDQNGADGDDNESVHSEDEVVEAAGESNSVCSNAVADHATSCLLHTERDHADGCSDRCDNGH